MNEPPLNPQQVLGLTPAQLPRHIAVIMDGNGRWASARGEPRIFGHESGARVVRSIVTHCARLGIEALTMYSFSSENWKRPKEEVNFLMDIYVRYLVAERSTIMDNDVRFVHLGSRDGLPPRVLEEMDLTVDMSKGNKGLAFCLALNYGSRAEIVDGVRRLAKEVAAKRLSPDDIDEDMVSNSLYTAGLPDPDLLIRTANEHRISNFLLWQISYAELHISPVLWPEFSVENLNEAIQEYAARDRRFGDVTRPQTTPAST